MTTDDIHAAGSAIGAHSAPVAASTRSSVRVQRPIGPAESDFAPVVDDVRRARRSVTPLELLPRDFFIAQLRREMRRADRSGSPLSMVIFRLAQSCVDADCNELANVVDEAKRESDVIGLLGPGMIGALCLDADDEGVAAFVRKIDARAGDLPYSAECATYPDQLFQGITGAVNAPTGPSPLLMAQRHRQRSDVYPLKRAIDVLGALTAAILLAPLMLVTALAVKLGSRGPVLFKQVRLGKDGKPFMFYKFRSMYVGDHEALHREHVAGLIKRDAGATKREAADKPWLKLESDPRITSVGRFIRRTSIDELPQLFNVLRGDMSLVGPRPPLPYEAENYHSWHLRRVLDVRPGMTGLWQVEGRGKLSFDEMVRMDLRYIGTCSLTLDLRILAKTVPVVLSCDGAS